MKITVSENYYINFDGDNYTPFRFEKGTGETFKVAGRDLVSKDKWVDSKKFFSKLGSALDWIATDTVCKEDKLALKEYIDRYESIKEELKGLVG